MWSQIRGGGIESSIYCFRNSSIELKSNICFYDSFWIECYNDSMICIGESSVFEGQNTISCHDNSVIYLDSEGQLGEKFAIVCYQNSSIKIGKKLRWQNETSISCYEDSLMSIGDNCFMARESGIGNWKNSVLKIGDNCAFQFFFYCANVYGGTIIIGNELMASYNVSIYNNDTHPIFNIDTHKRINVNRKIVISEHVWLGMKSTVLSGAEIGQSCIVGANSVVTKCFPNNCTIGGVPAHILNKNMTWDVKEEDINKVDKKYFRLTEE